MIMESMNAYVDGKRDAEQGKPKKNASDFWGPYAGDYQHGYEQHKLIGDGVEISGKDFTDEWCTANYFISGELLAYVNLLFFITLDRYSR